MTTPTTTTGTGEKKRITLERTFDSASIHDVWDLWTTKSGIEAWWGPGGFKVEVRKLDLHVGGQLHYAMIAVAPEMVEYMKKANMPTTTETSVTYTEINVNKRLAYVNHVDFVPQVEAYDVGTVVELHPMGTVGVRMVLILDAMHNEEWTNRAVMGWEGELGKLEELLAARKQMADARN